MAKNSSNVLALGVGLNLDPLNQDIATAAKTAKEGMNVVAQSVVDGGQKAGTATEKLGDKVQSMRAQLRQATQDAQQMAEKYGVMSTQAIASASRAGDLKDKIGDINTVITAFSADSKFTVVAGALQQAAGAASIVTGSMALLGVESKETEAMLLKVQGALALTQGLATIKEMGASFTALRAVIVGQVIPSLATMGVTMNMALGIFGIAAIAVTALVINFNNLSAADEKYRESLSKTIQTQALQAEMFKTLHDISTRGLEGRAAALKQEQNIYEENRKKLQLEGTAMFEAERVNGANIGFAKILWQQSVKDNYRIHLEQIAKINKEYDEKELNKTKQTHKELIKVNQETALIQSQFAGGGQMNLPNIQAPTKPTAPILSDKNSLANQIRQQTEDARNAMIKSKIILEEGIANMYSGLKEITDNSIANVFGSVGKTIGDSLAASLSGESTDMMDAIGVAIVKSLGQMAVQVGSMLIALSVPMMLAGIPQGYAYALAGTGLIAIGSTVSGLAGRKSGGSTQTAAATQTPTSNFNGNGSNYLGGNNSGNIVINGMIKGNDIQLVNGRNDRKFNRSLRFG
jgi:hypothetical protein